MLVVLAIIALLLSIAAPRYFGSLKHSREVALRENLRILRTSIEEFHSDKGRYPTDLAELVIAHYLRGVPVDPITESIATWKTSPADEETSGIADVRSGAVGQDASGTAYAAY